MNTYPLNETAPDALLIHCADSRFQEAFFRFTREELGLENPMLISAAGSISAFGVASVLPKGWNALKGQIETLVKAHPVARVVLINHDECKGYAKVAGLLGSFVNVQAAQKQHLLAMAEFLRKEFLPHAHIELYQAHIVTLDGTRSVQFEKIN